MEKHMSTTPEENILEPAAGKPAPDSFWGRNWQKITAVIIWIAIVGSFFGYSYTAYGTFLAFNQTLSDLVGLLDSPFGPLVYVLVYALRPLAFFSATVITLLAGAIWGPVLGVLFTIVAANISATVAYLLGRLLGQGVIDESQSEGIIARYASRMRDNSFETILIMRFIFLPYDLVNYLGGFLHIAYKPFILATILGSLPGTITFVLAGSSVDLTMIFEEGYRPDFNPWALAASAVVLVISLAFSRWLKQREAKRQARIGTPDTTDDATPDSLTDVAS
jgi:uncharacterized membrane protein YdjX (TVP38/TMEM64 family)